MGRHGRPGRTLSLGLAIGAAIGAEVLCAAALGYWAGYNWPDSTPQATPTAAAAAATPAPTTPTATLPPAATAELITLAPLPTLTETRQALPSATAAPAATEPPATVTPALAIGPASPPSWPASLLSGDLPGNYPDIQTSPSGRIRIHYQPGTFVAGNFGQVAAWVDGALAFDEARLEGQLKPKINIYLAGTLFASDPALQGNTESANYQSFILLDGAYNVGEMEYILAHELTHMVSTHVFGSPSSVMLHEGLGTYLPQEFLTRDGGYLSYQEFCAIAYKSPDRFTSAVQMAALTYGPNGFGGHVHSFFKYNLSACFVGYLIEKYGLTSLKEVYSSGQWVSVYNRSLAQLDQDWQATLASAPVTVDPARFVSLEDAIVAAYDTYFAAIGPAGGHTNWPAYWHLVHARSALNQGNLDLAQAELDAYRVAGGG